MIRQILATAALQSGVIFLIVWLAFRAMPSLAANTKSWVWRLAFIKPFASLLSLASITLCVLPSASRPVRVPSHDVFVGNTISSLPVVAAAKHPPQASLDPVVILWLLGVGGLVIHGLMSRVKLGKQIRVARAIEDADVREEFKILTDHAMLRRPVRLLCSDEIEIPLVSGGFRATIVIPSAALANGLNEDIRLMLAHEISHLARRDLGWLGLVWLAQTLFFFNPVVWIAARAARLDHESATDRYALTLAGVPTKTYAEMLIRATVSTRTNLAPGVLPMSESFRTIHKRIEAMNHFQSQPSRLRASAVGALALIVVGLLPTYQLAQASPHAPTQKKSKAPARKTPAKSVPKAPPITVEFKNTDVRQALIYLFNRTPQRDYVIDPEVQGVVTVSFEAQPFETCLQGVLDAVGATYTLDKKLYKVHVKKQ